MKAHRQDQKLKQDLRSQWFIPLRMAIFLLLFGAAVLPGGSSGNFLKVFLPYSVATLLFLVIAELNRRHARPWLLATIIYVHLITELLVAGVLIQVSGQLTPQYSVLLLLTIISSSLVFRLAGTLAVATMASMIYAFKHWLEAFLLGNSVLGDLQPLGDVFTGNDDLFYVTFLHICTFYLVAFISGYLAQRLQAKEGELSTASQRLERVRLDTDDILQNLHSGLLTLDARGYVVYFNRAAENILGVKQSEVRGRSFMQVFNHRMPEFAERVLSVLKLSQPSLRSEVEVPTTDGKPMPLGLTISVLGDDTDVTRGVIAIFQDLTAAKQLEDALMKADRLAAVGELSARIAHEIRNPLASISGSVEVLKAELQVTGDNRRLMDLIVKESERLSRTLSNFLSYARMEPTVRSKVELVSIAGETIELLRHRGDLPESVQLSLKTEFTTAYVVGDEDQLRQILINIISNALSALDPEGGIVEVAITDPGGWDDVSADEWISLTIRDDGCGFDPADRDRIFEPFFSRRSGGSGLGLAIVKRCVDNIGARIQVLTAENAGTTFALLLRRYAGSAEAHETVKSSGMVEQKASTTSG
jgi:two-component system sensor histidine kinase PilS (NtrC family)